MFRALCASGPLEKKYLENPNMVYMFPKFNQNAFELINLFIYLFILHQINWISKYKSQAFQLLPVKEEVVHSLALITTDFTMDYY